MEAGLFTQSFPQYLPVLPQYLERQVSKELILILVHRTTVVLVMAWFMVFVTGEQKKVRTVEKIELLFICLSGLATGASWLCYYRALQEGPASVVVPIDKLSMLITIAFSYIVFHEKLTKKAAFGVVLITAGTILLAMM